MAAVLYNGNSLVPILCERPNWKNCPEHKHLTDKRPKTKAQVEITMVEDELTQEEIEAKAKADAIDMAVAREAYEKWVGESEIDPTKLG